ncbi:expressed unknown protein [Seminavis robusta]|uniref:Uncharacterized protein n=1 Tax=Seminavis robusta TaxID=568900 RepID=A0A9N8EDK2_9STRA|nr:expressed unknown protein [Seminavis robusta]|eukprot:Sro840_g209410.1 n/a (261) ;mRNA; r:21547-22329
MISDNIDNSDHHVTALLRSVALKGGGPSSRLQPALLRRASSNEPDNLAKALKENNANDNAPQSLAVTCLCHEHIIQEEYLQDFLRWSNHQTVPLLPKVTHDCPLMPTSVTLKDVGIQCITESIANCLHRLHDRNILFAYKADPDHAGRIEICSMQCKLKFVIQLWQRPQLEGPSAVVVELQRRRGCPIFMHHLRRPLFKALKALSKEPLKRTLSCPSLAQNLDSLDAPNHGQAEDLAASRRSSLGHPPVRFPPPLRVNFS